VGQGQDNQQQLKSFSILPPFHEKINPLVPNGVVYPAYPHPRSHRIQLSAANSAPPNR